MKKFLAFLSVVYVRIKAESPPFFRRLGRFCLWLSLAAGTMSEQVQSIVVAATGYGLALPAWAFKLASYITLAGLVGKFFSSLPVDASKLSEAKYEKLADPKNTIEP